MDTYGLSTPVAAAGTDARADFITRTYLHLFGAILLFVGIEVALFQSGLAEQIAGALLGVNWLIVLGGFVLVSWFASRTAYSTASRPAQYAALGGFVLAEAIIFVPLLYVAALYSGPGVIRSAAWVTLLGFTGLTAVAVISRKDFSFLGALLKWGFVVAVVLIVASVLFGLELGTFFSVAMIALAGASILYDTSKIMRDFPVDRHVAAALQLFSSVALMFWYVLRLMMNRN